MDPWVFVAIVAVVVPVAVMWALARSAALRGAEPRPKGSRPVESLVTEVIPDDRPEEEREYPDDSPGTGGSGNGERPDR